MKTAPRPKNDPGSIMVDMQQTTSGPSAFQQRLSFFLLALLVAIIGSMVWLQGRYDPADWRGQPKTPSKEGAVKADWPDGLVPLSPPEKYHAENLSDKINGKADLYLSAGFKRLESRRFGLVSDKSRWMERYLYDMGGHQNAYAVFSAQRRKDTQDTDLTPQSYLSANGLFLVHGSCYLEIIASEATPRMQSQMRALASSYITANPVKGNDLPIVKLFMPEDKVPHTSKLIAASAFGIQGLDWVYTSSYASENGQAAVYISKRGSPSQARTSADKFIAYWNEYGGASVPAPARLPGVQIVFILDNYEIAAVLGDYFFGVHEATNLDFGLELISRVHQSIEEARQ
jgi:hypothetical protein